MDVWSEEGGDPHWANSNLGGMYINSPRVFFQKEIYSHNLSLLWSIKS